MAVATVAANLGVPRRWYQDLLVWLGVVVGVAAAAFVFFAGHYLPYDDWAGHVGLSAVLAHGGENGASVYLTQSLVPTPYMLFYVSCAAWAHVVPPDVGAKLNLLIATALLVIGSARLAEATGRSPRLALLAPLGLFGVSLGMGFSSFLFALPWIFFVLADLEWLLRCMRLDDPIYEREARVRSVFLGVWIALCFLGHGLVFVFAALLVAARLAVYVLPRWRDDKRGAARGILSVGLTVVPTVLLAVPSLLRRLSTPYVSPEFQAGGGPGLAGFASPSDHVASFAGDLLDRGGAGHGVTAALVGAVFLAWALSGRAGRHSEYERLHTIGPWVYFITMALVFVLGPVNAGWPVTFWVVYQRAGSLALLFLFLLPTGALSGRRTVLAVAALLPILHNAAVNREVVLAYSSWAAPYDQVRAMVPPGQRVLPLSRPESLGPWGRAANSLGFYHLADGAAYVPVGNVPEEMPVHRTNDAATPYNPSPYEYSPAGPGAQYDYLVLRGEPLVRATRGEPERFREVGEASGWVVFQNRAPPPRPTRSTP
jgi:hypothetical protein